MYMSCKLSDSLFTFLVIFVMLFNFWRHRQFRNRLRLAIIYLIMMVYESFVSKALLTTFQLSRAYWRYKYISEAKVICLQ